MAENSYFLVGAGVDGWTPVAFEGRPVASCYEALCAALQAAGAAEAVPLFAEPLATWSNGAAPTKISWYGPRDGEAVVFDKLTGPARSAAEEAVRAAFAPLRSVLADPALNALLAAALELPSRDGLLLVGGSPILVYWGFRPEGVRTPAEIAAHREALFGDLLVQRVGDGAAAPAATAPRTVPMPAAAAVGVAAGSAALSTASAASAPPAAPAADGKGAEEPERPAAAWWAQPWFPLAATVALLALLLLVLTIPGVLIRPGEAGPDFDLALRKEINRSLEERLALLKAAGADGQCRTEAATRLLPLAPTTVATRPVPPPGPASAGGTSATPPAPGPAPQGAAAPPEPPPAPPAGGAAPAETASPASLLNELDAATVLVLATGGAETSVGSAFYVNPSQLVTNLHVVEKAGADGLFVISQALRTPRPARIVARSPGSEIGQADFAVVEVAGDVPGKALRLTEAVDRLQNVVAAGFPAVIMETDAEFQRLREGDAAAIPQMAVTQGVVTAVQPQAQGLGIVAHTATISPGNSGGPLVDSCGRVVGVNTFGRSDASSALRVNYALLAGSLRAFLDRNGIAHQTGAGACRPAEISDASAGQAR